MDLTDVHDELKGVDVDGPLVLRLGVELSDSSQSQISGYQLRASLVVSDSIHPDAPRYVHHPPFRADRYPPLQQRQRRRLDRDGTFCHAQSLLIFRHVLTHRSTTPAITVPTSHNGPTSA